MMSGLGSVLKRTNIDTGVSIYVCVALAALLVRSVEGKLSFLYCEIGLGFNRDLTLRQEHYHRCKKNCDRRICK